MPSGRAGLPLPMIMAQLRAVFGPPNTFSQLGRRRSGFRACPCYRGHRFLGSVRVDPSDSLREVRPAPITTGGGPARELVRPARGSRIGLNHRCPRLAEVLEGVEGAPWVVQATVGEEGPDRVRVLDCHATALALMRQRGMSGVAEKDRSTTTPSRESR